MLCLKANNNNSVLIHIFFYLLFLWCNLHNNEQSYYFNDLNSRILNSIYVIINYLSFFNVSEIIIVSSYNPYYLTINPERSYYYFYYIIFSYLCYILLLYLRIF